MGPCAAACCARAVPPRPTAPSVSLVLDGGRGTVSDQAQSDGAFDFSGVPLGCFRVEIIDPVTKGQGRSNGCLASNGEVLDLGTVTLDDSPVSVSRSPRPTARRKSR